MNDSNIEKPFVIDETEHFAVVYKPPRMHSAPLAKSAEGDSGAFYGSLLDWYAALFPPVMDLCGRKGGLLHRLDFETQGLMLFSKNQKSLDYLLALQEEGNFIKEYKAICPKNAPANPSFPPSPITIPCEQDSFVIESYFRPFGPGRKQVRPLIDSNKKGKEIAKDRNGYYQTEIVSIADDEYYTFSVRLRRGFRHQIRCHLAWIGCPVLHDPLYAEQPGDGFLALCSNGLIFSDPESGKPREYHI